MDSILSMAFDSLSWLMEQLAEGRLPKVVIGVVVLTTISGLVIAVFQVPEQPADKFILGFFIFGLAACIGAALGLLVGVGLVWLVTWALTPAWDISGRIESLEDDHQEYIFRVDLLFINAGYGTATNLAIRFEALNAHLPCETVGLGDPATQAAIDTSQTHLVQLTSQTHLVQLYWHRDEPLDGILTLTTRQKSGFGSKAKYHLRTYLDKNNPHQGWCDVKPRP